MFYNHDILTDRKHGVATIWLVATLGSKSSLRKVTRKAIMDVDVPSACQTITDPSAPLALRLQGSLLFGVSRVFSQQCGYVLTDMQSLQDKMRDITMLFRELEVNPDVVATRPEQINLQIDPSFSIDLDLGFDLSSFDLHNSSTVEHSSLLSPRTSASSRTSFHDDEFGLHEPLPPNAASPTHEGLGDPDFDDYESFRDRQAQPQTVLPQELLLNQTSAIAEDDSIHIQDDGEIVFRTNIAPDELGPGGVEDILPPGPRTDYDDLGLDFGDDLESDKIDPAQQPDNDQAIFDDIDMHPMTVDQPLQSSSPTTQRPELNDMLETIEEDAEAGDEADAETITVAQAAPQRNRLARSIPIDDPAELQNATLGEWDTRYLELMESAHAEHAKKISVPQAKRNAAYWILDQGIGRVSADFREDSDEHPLAFFSGEALLEMLGGPDTHVAGRKRSASAVAEDEEGERRVRSRSDEDPIGQEEEDSQPGDDNDQLPPNNEDEIPEPEMGRQQEVPLSDGPERLPWNDYAFSHHGSRPGSVRPPMSIAGISSSAGGPAHIDFMPSSHGSRRISRMVQESPLHRRHLLRQSSLTGSATRADAVDLDNALGGDDFTLGLDLDETVELDGQLGGEIPDADFEIYGPAALASTQQAADSQWLAATLEQEAHNFLAFLSGTIDGRKADEGEQEETTVTFEELLPPERNSYIVAAQGLLHVLSLATKGLIEVLQEEAFGDIELGIAEIPPGPVVEAI